MPMEEFQKVLAIRRRCIQQNQHGYGKLIQEEGGAAAHTGPIQKASRSGVGGLQRRGCDAQFRSRADARARLHFPELRQVSLPVVENRASTAAARFFEVIENELAKKIRIFRVRQASQGDQFWIVAALEAVCGIEDVGYTVSHAGSEVAACFAQDDGHTARHILTAVVADAFYYRDGPAVAHTEALAGASCRKHTSGRSAIQCGVADDSVLMPFEARVARRTNYNFAAAHALPHIIVGVAFQNHPNAVNQERSKALP